MIRKLLASLLMAVSTILVVQQAIAQNNALSFDGVNDYVDLGTPGQLAIERTNAFTWEAWIKTSSGAQQTMFANMQSGAPNRGFDIFIQNGQLRLTLSSTYGSNYLETYTSTLVNTGNWTHVAISYDGSSAASGVKMYINGVSQTVGIHFNGLSSTIQIADHVIMGARNGLVFPFNGQMDEVRWWNQVRTASQIAGYRQCRLANSGSNLLLNYHFNQGTAGANNAGIVTLTYDGSAAINGTLVNFGLTGVASNWVDGSANGVNASCQANRYVKAGASPGGNGLSWATAYSNLQDAIQEALSGNGISEIWVAIGTYYPDALPGQDNNRAAFFTMRNNLGVYGGFAGTETALDQRNWATNPTILSGEIQQDADYTNNSFRIFLNDNNGLNNTAILDGFTITGAYNTDLRGGGMYNNASSPSIANCRFVNNSARNGGGIANYYFVAPQITNCSFTGNTAVLTGGGIFNYESAEAVITNCSFYGNKVPTTNGGAIYNLFANSKIVNSICWGNGTEIVNSGATPDVTYSTVQGGYAGTGNLATYPMFLDTANADLRLMSGSPARDNGSNIANTTSRDLAGKARIVGGTIDRGAYEWTACSGITRLYVKWDAVGAGDGASWTSAFKTLREALAVAAGNACIDQIWVARGTYYPDDPGLENDRGASFTMRNNLAIYGGFAGNETSPVQRKLAANPSILSGEIQQDADGNNNSYHVISNYGNSLNNTAILDGFTITGGCANGGGQSGWGAGMLNYLSSPTIRNCIFSGNTAQMGGGMFNTSLFSVPSIINCIFSGNLATTGGGMALWSSSATISNCSFSGNSAFIAGAIANLNGSLNAPAIIHNTIIYGNSSGLNNNTDAPPLIYNSLVQERAGGSYGNLDGSINPFFVDAPSYTNAPFTGGNYRLRYYSPAINAGNNDSIPAVISTDIAGYARINEDTVDMGAHEFGCGSLSRLYVKQAAAGAGHGYDWANAYTTLTGALAYAQSCDAITEIWVAQGTYYPSTTDRSLSFDLKNGLAIYGGFAGTETSLSERNSVWQHATILSGNGVTGRSTNVVRAGNVNNTALLDGFYIQDGLANDNGFNSGAGLQLINSSPVIRDCIIRNNRSEYARWAALSVSNPALPDSLLVEHCVFQNNTMQYTTDGVIGVSQGKAIFKNCVFTQNTGVFDADVATIKSCNNTIWGNEGSLLRAFANSHIDIVNSIVNSAPVIVNQSTVAIHNSRVPTALLGYGSGNLDIDPQLRNTADGDGVDNTWGTTDDGYALKPCAPATAIDAGNNGYLGANDTTDFINNVRVYGGTVDMGAYESIGKITSSNHVIYVDAINGNDDNTGLNWDNSFKTFSKALATVKQDCYINFDSIFVAAGTYQAAAGQSYTMIEGVKIFGGFPAGGGTWAQRDWLSHNSILQGNGNRVVSNNGNGLTTAAVLDGFTVKGGNTSGGGAGMYNASSSPSIINCNFSENNATSGGGGGMYNVSASPSIFNCSFYGNVTTSNGGGMYNVGATPVIRNCRFLGNTAGAGAGMYNNSSSLSVVNCSFTGNRANTYGAGMLNAYGAVNISNCSFSGDAATLNGGAIANTGNPTINIVNSIIYGNNSGIYNESSGPVISYSLVQGVAGGANGNLDGNIDPRFESAPSFSQAPFTGGSYQLQPCSPVIDMGTNAGIPAGITIDLAGNPRIYGGTVDLGAHESLGKMTNSGHIVYVDSANGNDGYPGDSWAHPFKTFGKAVAVTKQGCYANVDSIFVAAGTYQPGAGQSFTMKEGVKIFGGFPTGGGPWAQRNWLVNTSKLQGNGKRVINNEENGLTASAVIDGFTISGGTATGGSFLDFNGMGAGMFNQKVAPTVRNCIFWENSASYGGGMANLAAYPVIVNCIFSSNHALRGVGLYNLSSAPVVRNCVFWGNATGEAITNTTGSATPILTDIRNSIIYGNSSGVYNDGNGGALIYNSLVQGLAGGSNGNLDGATDPLFVNAPAGDFHLLPCSPAINVGDNAGIPPGITTDIAGNPRIYDGTVDMGAFERQSAKPTTTTWYLDVNATGNGDGASWANAFTNLATALSQLKSCNTANTLLIAKGTYNVGAPFEFDRLQGTVLGGYPTGGGTRNPQANETIVQGVVNVRQSMRIDGIRVKGN